MRKVEIKTLAEERAKKARGGQHEMDTLIFSYQPCLVYFIIIFRAYLIMVYRVNLETYSMKLIPVTQIFFFILRL